MESRRKDVEEDYPPYSRLFIICGKTTSEQMLRVAFEEFGEIEDVFLPRDHTTGEFKGVAYIKYSKTSQAARALEAMNGRPFGNSARHLKVLVANNRSEIQEEGQSKERYLRLFVTIPKTATEREISGYFEQFGTVSSIDILRDHETSIPKGFAFVKYRYFSEAALAFELAEKKYKVLFAQPKSTKRKQTTFEANITSLAESSYNAATMNALLQQSMNCAPQGYTRVKLMCSPYLTAFNIRSIFDLIPGLVDFQYMVDLMANCGKGMAFYSNPTSAAYAVQKLHTFEYPPGQSVLVKPDFHNSGDDNYNGNYSAIPNMVNTLQNAISTATNSGSPDIAKLAAAIAEASKLVKTLGGVDSDQPDTTDIIYCSAQLPDPQPLAHIDKSVAKRCFLVCKPKPPPLNVLRDIFCRFGDLITVYCLNNKTVGYACYASAESADRARETLHGAEVCGIRIKVLEAEEEDVTKSKKRRQ